MENSSVVTCSFTMDRELYNTYKGICAMNGENVKGNLINYMKKVINYEIPNAETIEAIEEVQIMKKNPALYKSYNNFADLLKDLDK